MKPEITKLKQNNYLQSILKAKEMLDNGSVIVIPTGTCYVLAADAFNKLAVKKVYKIKGRESKKPISVLIYGVGMAEKIAKLTNNARVLIKKFLPGPLTIILKKRNDIKIPVANNETVGITSARQNFCIDLLKKFNKPITSTSANPSGGSPPFDVENILKQFSTNVLPLIDNIFDVGKLPKTKTSTVIDLASHPPQILREGPITKEEIEKVLGTSINST